MAVQGARPSALARALGPVRAVFVLRSAANVTYTSAQRSQETAGHSKIRYSVCSLRKLRKYQRARRLVNWRKVAGMLQYVGHVRPE